MPVDHTGFTLKPVGFFDRNPALDVPATRGAHCHNGDGHGGPGEVHGPAKERAGDGD
jgi:primary-amine oxidase